ncbi:hypothetical protein E2P81_ATG00485 [Venturia nashicola]|nr:hypothetical protein E2P81_ATG00485 [Venturia nashicola]
MGIVGTWSLPARNQCLITGFVLLISSEDPPNVDGTSAFLIVTNEFFYGELRDYVEDGAFSNLPVMMRDAL